MGKIFILAGMMFGDEGKGSFVDYIAHEHNIRQIIRYNGGSQASHTVRTPDGLTHKFSQLGSGMFAADCKTCLTGNMVINPFNIIEEIKEFSSKTGISGDEILERIYIEADCYIVTPYHKLMNRLRELSKGTDRIGSVGTGVSEVRLLLRPPDPLGVQIKDLYCNDLLYKKLTDLFDHVSSYYDQNQGKISQNIPPELRDSIDEQIRFLTQKSSVDIVCGDYYQLVKDYRFKICDDLNMIIDLEDGVIFEPAQGLLLDAVYGIKPNTTQLDTTIFNALRIVDEIDHKEYDVIKAGVAKAYSSRHGIGVFPTEDIELDSFISDDNQEESFWNGKIRIGWFDAVLTRYAQSINNVNELYISSIDKLDKLHTIKICNGYSYNGVIDDEFRTMFEFEESDTGVLIRDIKNTGLRISGYLAKCDPVYIDLNGWHEDTSKIRYKNDLPHDCQKYIEKVEVLTGIPVSLISVGAARNEKVLM